MEKLLDAIEELAKMKKDINSLVGEIEIHWDGEEPIPDDIENALRNVCSRFDKTESLLKALGEEISDEAHEVDRATEKLGAVCVDW